MLTNDDLKLIEDVTRFLNGLATPRSVTLCNKLVKLHNKVVDNRNKQSDRSNEYNKKNKEYHRLMNSKYYNQDVGNWSKVREIEEKLEQLKDKKIPLF